MSRQVRQVQQETIVGSAGGLAIVKQRGLKYMSKLGKKGGLATSRKYSNTDFYQLIGSLGAHAINEHLSKTRKMKTERTIRKLVAENS